MNITSSGADRIWHAVLTLLMCGCLVAGAGRVRLAQRENEEPAARIRAAAKAFAASLTTSQREKVMLPWASPLREDWHYVPREHAGLELGAMNDAQRIKARELLRTALSSQGMNKVEQIMLLDSVLREIEKGTGPRRDPLAYALAIFGDVDGGEWGWKIEGHHVSLNFTVGPGAVAVTPAFLGANPAEVRQGERAGVRVLAAEEDLGWELLMSLTAEQRGKAVISQSAPGDILAVPGRELSEVDGTGLLVAEMNEPQRRLVDALIEEFATNLRGPIAQKELERIRKAGVDKLRFAWMGGMERGKGHYYRLSGPVCVIEYDNTQNNANHVHTVWRDRERDFGRDILKEHVQKDHPDAR